MGLGIRGRFGQFKLFVVGDKLSDLKKKLEFYHKISDSKIKSGWNCYRDNYEDIFKKTLWAYKNISYISSSLPRTPKGKLHRNKHLIIKEYERKTKVKAPTELRGGFIGTNLRLVVAIDKNREISCQYGEFYNFSGLLLAYRKNYPSVGNCERCGAKGLLNVCGTCGYWYCVSCTRSCKECDHNFCITCFDNVPGLPKSVHNHYFHKPPRSNVKKVILLQRKINYSQETLNCYKNAVGQFENVLIYPETFPAGGWLGALLDINRRYTVQDAVTLLQDWGKNPDPKVDPFGWFINLSSLSTGFSSRFGITGNRIGGISTITQMQVLAKLLESEPYNVIESLREGNNLDSRRALARLFKLGQMKERQGMMSLIWNNPLREFRRIMAQHPAYSEEFKERGKK